MADPLEGLDPAAANSGFAAALDDPRTRAALLQFGLTLMSPNYGNTPSGALAQAIGSAGQAVTRQEEADQKDRERESKLAVQNSQISAREDRARAAQEALGLRQQGLGLQQMFGEQKLQNEQLKLQQRQEEAERKAQERVGKELFQKDTIFQNRVNRDAKLIADQVKADKEALTEWEKNYSIYGGDKNPTTAARMAGPKPVPANPDHFARYQGKSADQIASDLAASPAYQSGFVATRPSAGQPTTQPAGVPRVQPMSTSGGGALPVPQSKSELKDGVTYATSHGPATWNERAQRFYPVAEGM